MANWGTEVIQSFEAGRSARDKNELLARKRKMEEIFAKNMPPVQPMGLPDDYNMRSEEPGFSREEGIKNAISEMYRQGFPAEAYQMELQQEDRDIKRLLAQRKASGDGGSAREREFAFMLDVANRAKAGQPVSEQDVTKARMLYEFHNKPIAGPDGRVNEINMPSVKPLLFGGRPVQPAPAAAISPVSPPDQIDRLLPTAQPQTPAVTALPTQRPATGLPAGAPRSPYDPTSFQQGSRVTVYPGTKPTAELFKEVDDLSKRFYTAGVPATITKARSFTKNMLEKYTPEQNPGMGGWKNFRGTVPFTGANPANLAMSEKGKDIKSAFVDILNDLLKMYSGLAIPPPEELRQLQARAVDTSFTARDFYNAWPRVLEHANQTVANELAGKDERIVKEYKRRNPNLDLSPLTFSYKPVQHGKEAQPSQPAQETHEDRVKRLKERGVLK